MATTPTGSAVTAHAIRLTPGEDLRQGLLAFARRAGLQAGAVVTCVGSLTEVCLRYANQPAGATRAGPFEIVSLVGTLTESDCHLHVCVSDGSGATLGGHLLDGCRVFTTAEVVVAELVGLHLRREPDPATGYAELVVVPMPGEPPA